MVNIKKFQIKQTFEKVQINGFILWIKYKICHFPTFMGLSVKRNIPKLNRSSSTECTTLTQQMLHID